MVYNESGTYSPFRIQLRKTHSFLNLFFFQSRNKYMPIQIPKLDQFQHRFYFAHFGVFCKIWPVWNVVKHCRFVFRYFSYKYWKFFITELLQKQDSVFPSLNGNSPSSIGFWSLGPECHIAVVFLSILILAIFWPLSVTFTT